MNIRAIIFFFGTMLLLVSCKKDDLKKTEDRLVGEWSWIRSTGGLMGTTLTPASEGYNESYLFQKNGTL